MKDRFEVLDIFRGIFSAMVVFFHMSFFSATPLLNNSFIYNSDLFVDFFFVLSGFVIAYSYRQMNSYRQVKIFLKKRISRLYPLHLIMLLVFVVIELSKHLFEGRIQINNLNNENNSWHTFVSSLLLMNSVKQPGVTDVSWNIPSWSISAEMISYLMFGSLLFGLYKLQNLKNRNYFFAFIAVTSIAIMFIINGNYKINYSFNYGFLRGLAGFFTGVLCLNLFNFLRNNLNALPDLFFHISELLLIVSIGIYIYRGDTFKNIGFIYEIAFFSSVLIFAFERGFISGLLKRSGFLKKMGKYSYSIYMTHAFILSIFNIIFIRLLHFPPSAYAYLFIVNYFIIYKVSQWTYTNIEMRFSWKNKLARRKATTANYSDKVLTA
ncbi:acyltransferase [Panacibacter ginsenosidivorans]|uniref:Acyltransferase n=1 Tax=Panacibacter ginsenosidivorans TaxID=1813871 RepID=A0A5B8V7H0_9BACT|nr:acyltransferase [Panacibacter ginsenosidivorans]QEC66636.1 acyltransferase [Panacibacter ginsenosidivorans]